MLVIIKATKCDINCCKRVQRILSYVILYLQNSVVKKQEDDSSGVATPGYITLILVTYT